MCIIDEAIAYIRELFKENADGHGFDHSMRVYRNAMFIAEGVACDRQIVGLAALLHDADDYKLFNTAENANARSFLTEHGVDRETTERIIAAINAVSFSKNRDRKPGTFEGQIVQDADRLDAIGAVGIARTFAYGGKHGRSMDESVEHFHQKLLLLKDMMNTAQAKKMAEKRHQLMETFLRNWEKENEWEVIIMGPKDKEQEWTDEIPDEEEQDNEYEPTYRDGSAKNECWEET